MEQLKVKPQKTTSETKCLQCHRELIKYSPTPEEKVKYSKQLNDEYKLGLEPSDVVILAHPCSCGQPTQIFYRDSEQLKDLA